MTDDDVCGYEGTTTGEPCQHPAGSCPVPSHSDPEAENPGGRPSKLDDARDDLLEAARNGTTKEGCARAAGIHPSTLYDWLNEYSEFSEAFSRARAEAEQDLVADARADDPKWVLERSYGYVKTERREVEADVDADVSTSIETDGFEFSFMEDDDGDE